jgi:hypothetical protein
MKRATFYRVALAAAVAGAGIGIFLLGLWKFMDVVNTDVWTWLYPASLMFMAAEGASTGGQVAVVVLSIATNAGLYFIAASAICGVVAGFRRGIYD